MVATNIHLAVDSGGFVWKHKKSLSYVHRSRNNKDASQEDYEAKMKAFKWKREKFPKGLNKNLNEIALLMKENEDDYFFLIARVLQGYLPKSTSDYPETLHYERRKANLQKLKTWFKYDKNACKDGLVLPNLAEGRAPWMELVWKEEAKNLKETGTNEEIQKYFDGTAYEKSMRENTTNEKDVAWCAAFINWIMKHYGYNGITTDRGYDAVRALKWAEWPEGRDVGKPVYGAIAVKTRTGGGHVGYVAGKKGNKVVILGGNQSQKLYCVSYEISDYFAYVIPKNYEITDADYNLPEYKGNPGAKESEL